MSGEQQPGSVWQIVPDERKVARVTHDVAQLARFMQARDAQQFGVKTDEGWTPSWDDTGADGQQEYMNDATASVEALASLGWVPIERTN